ncbi:MAG: GNAT family N-acetyltransferase, partial [Marmoricola sp.]
MNDVTVVRAADESDAALVVDLIHRSFANRPVLDPPATAMSETEESVRAALASHGGLVAEHDGVAVGSLLFAPDGGQLWLRRVGVLAEARHHGIARKLTQAAEEHAVTEGFDRLAIEARAELPATVQFWAAQGYIEADREGTRL